MPTQLEDLLQRRAAGGGGAVTLPDCPYRDEDYCKAVHEGYGSCHVMLRLEICPEGWR